MTSLRTNSEAPRWWALSLLYAAAMALVALLVAVSTLGPSFGLVALGAAALIGLVATAGTERLGVAAIAGGYFTAPFYKGVAFGRLSGRHGHRPAPRRGLRTASAHSGAGSVRLPRVYSGRRGAGALAGMGASVFSDKTGESFVNLGLLDDRDDRAASRHRVVGSQRSSGRSVGRLVRGRSVLQPRPGDGAGQGGTGPASRPLDPPQLPCSGRDAGAVPAALPGLPTRVALRALHRPAARSPVPCACPRS